MDLSTRLVAETSGRYYSLRVCWPLALPYKFWRRGSNPPVSFLSVMDFWCSVLIIPIPVFCEKVINIFYRITITITLYAEGDSPYSFNKQVTFRFWWLGNKQELRDSQRWAYVITYSHDFSITTSNPCWLITTRRIWKEKLDSWFLVKSFPNSSDPVSQYAGENWKQTNQRSLRTNGNHMNNIVMSSLSKSSIFKMRFAQN